jgi:hypothetical protein
MKEKQARVFSLLEVNSLLSEVAVLTSEVVKNLDVIRQRYRIEAGQGSDAMPEPAIKEIETELNQWTARISELGALPKGFFTVDFQSREPELLYCWTYGEEKIEFAHKVWENFTHRKPLAESLESGSDHLKWIN